MTPERLVISALSKMILEEFATDRDETVAEIVDTWQPTCHPLTDEERQAVSEYFAEPEPSPPSVFTNCRAVQNPRLRG